MAAAAEYCGIAYMQFYRAVKTFKLIPTPKHRYGESRRLYYTRSEVEGFKALFDRYEAEKAKK